MQPTLSIAIIGGGSCSAEETTLAEAIGGGLARHGVTLICGGLGGVMEASCKGAATKGDVTVGILPGNDARAANPYVQIPVITYGTLSEIAYALQAGNPIVGAGTWELSRNGEWETSIIRASEAETAVELAVAAALSRLSEGKQVPPKTRDFADGSCPDGGAAK